MGTVVAAREDVIDKLVEVYLSITVVVDASGAHVSTDVPGRPWGGEVYDLQMLACPNHTEVSI